MQDAEQADRRRRTAIRLLTLFVVLDCALAVALGVLYDPHASGSHMAIHIAVAAVGLGLVLMLVGLLMVFILGARGRAFPPED